MKKVVLMLLFATMWYGCLSNPYSNRWNEYYQQNYNNLVNIENLSKEQAELIRSDTADQGKLMLNIDKAKLIRADQENQCSWAYGTSSYIDCLTNLRLVAEQSAQMEIITAKYFAQKGMKDKAKEMYRNIITTYVGDAYRSYVKQAEFGLEDLKENK